VSYIEWMIKGPEIGTCNCDWGCPCQFNALPTRGDCRAAVAMRIDEGKFGDVDLSGMIWANVLEWPGPIHEGGGSAQIIINDTSSEEQRTSLIEILAGRETEPGATIFNVFESLIDTIHPPLFMPIDFEVDIEARTGRFVVDGVVEAIAEPIRNPVTNEPHHARVTLPHGFEYTTAEYCSSTVNSQGAIANEWANRHGHLTMLHMNNYGPVRPQ